MDVVETIVVIRQSQYRFVLLYRMLSVGGRGEDSIFLTSDDTAGIQGGDMGDSETGRSAVGGGGEHEEKVKGRRRLGHTSCLYVVHAEGETSSMQYCKPAARSTLRSPSGAHLPTPE